MHSVLVMLTAFAPFFVVYQKKAVPYFLALAQHALIGDFIGGGVQLLWPLTTQPYGIGIAIRSQTNVGIEWIAFVALQP